MEVKVVISYSNGKTEQKEFKEAEAEQFIGYKLGDTFEGSMVGISGSLVITGGSDSDGFPMKKGVYGSRRVKLLLANGIGYNPEDDGIRKKKRVRGDTITEDIVQINTKVLSEPEVEAPVEKPEPEPQQEAPEEQESAPEEESTEE